MGYVTSPIPNSSCSSSSSSRLSYQNRPTTPSHRQTPWALKLPNITPSHKSNLPTPHPSSKQPQTRHSQLPHPATPRPQPPARPKLAPPRHWALVKHTGYRLEQGVARGGRRRRVPAVRRASWCPAPGAVRSSVRPCVQAAGGRHADLPMRLSCPFRFFYYENEESASKDSKRISTGPADMFWKWTLDLS